MKKNKFEIIEPISSMPVPVAPQPPSLNILSALNPLGAIADIVSSIADYKRRVKEIEFQMLQVREQACLMHDKIEAEKEIALANLESQKARVMKYLTTTSDELREAGLQRQEVISMISTLNTVVMDKSFSVDDKEKVKDIIVVLSEMFIKSGEQSMSKFNTAVECISAQMSINTDANRIMLTE